MKKLYLLLVLFAAWPAFGQTPSRVDGVLQDALGRALSGATVYVCTQPCTATTTPPSPLATIYADSSSTPVATAGQVPTDGNGNFFFYTLGSLFTEVFVYRGKVVKILPDQTPKGGGAGFSCGSPTNPGILYFNGTVCLVDPNATDDGNGNIIVASLTTAGTVTASQFVTSGTGGIFGGTEQTVPATPASGQFALYVDSGSNTLTCILHVGNCNSAGGGGGTTLSTNGTNNSSQTALNFVTSPAFNGLTLTPSNPGGAGNEQFTFTGTLGNAGLANSTMLINGVTCTLGTTLCTVSSGGSGLLNSQGPQTAVTGTGSAANVYTFTIPGGTMSSTSCIRVFAAYQHTTGSASVLYIWNYGGTTFTSSGISGTGAAQNGFLVCNNGATNSQYTTAFTGYINGTSVQTTQFGTSAIDTTANQTISFQFNVAATDAVTPKMWIVESVH